MARCLFEFMEALDHPMTSYQSKSLGVPSLAEPFRQSSHYGGPQLEIPDWMSSFISKDSKLFQSSNLLHKHEFTVADSFKLFLAVIVYDTGSVRSEQFVRILRLVLPHFQEREPELVANGLCSLAEAFSRFARTSKPLVPPSFLPPAVAPLSHQYADDTTWNFSQFSLLGKLSGTLAVKGMTWAQNDRVAIKHEFVCLVQEYCDRGGQLIDVQHQQLAMLIRSIIKDYTLLKIPCTTDWIKEYVCRVILPTQSPQLAGRAGMHLTVQFSYGIRAHYKIVDFSGLMKGLALVVEDHRHFLRSSLEFSNLLRERIVITALSLALKGEWHTASVHVSQAKFCSSLVDLLLAMVNHCDADTLAELELANPSPRLMAYIIIPMCLRFKNRSSTKCLDVLEMQFWLRMLGLTIRSAESNATLRRSSRLAGLLAPVLNATRISNKRQSSMEMTSPLSSSQQQTATLAPSVLLSPSVGMVPPTPGLSRISSMLNRDDQPEEDPQPQPSDSTMNVSPGLLVDFIALRIILVRGERYLSYHPGCWLDIFNVIKKYFSVHAFMKSAFSGSSSSRHGRQASFSGSGPSSPNVMSPFPLSPRLDGPRVPDLWQGGGGSGGITPFPGLFRQSNDISPGARTGSHKETVPTTALGYLLWTFAETVVFNCLPLMVVMRPYLLDQLRQVQDQQQVSTLRTSRSAGSSGPNSPAFYWPSPAILSSGQFGPGLSPWSVPSPSHRRTDSGASLHTRELPDSAKQQPKADRKKQWKGWSRPSETLSPTTPMDKPYSCLSSPMSPHQSPQGHQRQRSPMSSTSENPSTSHTTPRTGLQGHFWGHHKHHQRSESDANNINANTNSTGNNSERAKHPFPKVLVDRANKSLERVRVILLSSASTNAAAAYSENRSGAGSGIFSFPPTPSGLSPSMARQSPVERRRDTSPFPSSDPLTSQSNDHHFLHPGKYEPHPHPPISPGFGTMFLAREAAIKNADVSSQSSPEQTVGQGSPASMSAPQARTLAIPGTPGTENGRPPMGSIAGSPDKVHITLGKSRADNAEVSPNLVLELPHSARSVTAGELSISTPVTPSNESTTLTVEGSSTVSGLSSKNSRRSILKSTLTPEGDTNQQQSQTSLSSPSLGVHGPVRKDTYTIRRFDSRNTEDGVSFASGIGDSMCEKEPGITAQEQDEYSVAGLRARTKAFIQNIEEETRMVLA
ncbi:hypothetical protein BGX34_004679, partial [Mortierella sp. NVP85]